jgi:small subunit ribosomal protein S2
VALLTKIIADAVAEGLIERHQKPNAEGNVSAVEPLAEWERELLEQPTDGVPVAPEAAEPATTTAEPAAKTAEPAKKAAAEKKPAAKKAETDDKKPAAKKAPAAKAAAPKAAEKK